jgi:hypothetical protein
MAFTVKALIFLYLTRNVRGLLGRTNRRWVNLTGIWIVGPNQS